MDTREILYHFTIRTIIIWTLGPSFADDQYTKKMAIKLEMLTNTSGKATYLDAFPWLRYFDNATYQEMIELKKGLCELWSYVRPKIKADMDADLLRDCVCGW